MTRRQKDPLRPLTEESPARAELCAIVVGAPHLCKCVLQLLYTRS